LVKVVIRPGVETREHVLLFAPRCEHEDRQIPRSLELASKLKAAESGKHDVDQQQIRWASLCFGQTYPAVSSLDNIVALVLEVRGDEVQNVLVVLHHKDHGTTCSHLYR
jgi:hypothetical protein